MKRFMWSWKKFILGIAVDKMPLPSSICCEVADSSGNATSSTATLTDSRMQSGFQDAWVIALHLGFLTIVFDSRTFITNQNPPLERAEPPPRDFHHPLGPEWPPEPDDALERLLEAQEWKHEVWNDDQVQPQQT